MIASDGAIARGDEPSSERFVQPRTRHKSRQKKEAAAEGAAKLECRQAGDTGDFGKNDDC